MIRIYAHTFSLLFLLSTSLLLSTQHSADACCAEAQQYAKNKDQGNALTAYKQALSIDPDHISAHLGIAGIMRGEQKYDQAVHHYERAFAHAPDNMFARFDYAYCCVMIGKVAPALNAYSAILKHMPNHAQALYNTAYALKMAGRMKEALTFYDLVLKVNPDSDQAKFGKARTYVSMGDFASGWPAYRAWLKKNGKDQDPLHTWVKNNELNGKIILLTPEGSLGDTIHFIRYAQTLKNMGATVIAAVQKSLIPLLSRCDYIDMLKPARSVLPGHHARATVMNMPAVCDSNDETIPKNIPYIHPDSRLVEYWGTYLGPKEKMRIGLCWQADVYNDSSRPPVGRRGIPLEKLYALGRMKHVELYSLQQYDGLEQLEHLPDDFNMHIFDNTFDKEHGAFMDTAAVMKHLDLVITVDTSIAHLAGALGVPVFTMLPYHTDWRWIVGRTNSPWYPTMRIFKQPRPFDWDTVAKQIIEVIKQLTANK